MNNQYGSKQNNQLQGQMGKLSLQVISGSYSQSVKILHYACLSVRANTFQQSDSQPVNLLDGRNFFPPEKDGVNVSLPPVSTTLVLLSYALTIWNRPN